MCACSDALKCTTSIYLFIIQNVVNLIFCDSCENGMHKPKTRDTITKDDSLLSATKLEIAVNDNVSNRCGKCTLISYDNDSHQTSEIIA